MQKRLVVNEIEAQELVDLFIEAQLKIKSEQKTTECFNEMLSRKQAADLLKLSLPTLTKYVKNGIIPCYRIGHRILFDKSKILDSLHEVQKSNFKSYTS